jgi:hypothetical protein
MMWVVLDSVKYISYVTVLLSHFFFCHSPYHVCYVMGWAIILPIGWPMLPAIVPQPTFHFTALVLEVDDNNLVTILRILSLSE